MSVLPPKLFKVGGLALPMRGLVKDCKGQTSDIRHQCAFRDSNDQSKSKEKSDSNDSTYITD